MKIQWMPKIQIGHLLLGLLLVLVCLNVYAAVDSTAVHVKWSYKGNTGPMHWGRLDPHFRLCGIGQVQSPVNIPHNAKSLHQALVIHYQFAPMVIVENGETDLVIGGTQTLINDGRTVQLNFSSDPSKEFIMLDNKKYRLIQFHFHSPSENTLHGASFPLEIHFVHQSDEGKLAVMGVWVKEGSPNKTLQSILNHLPTDHGKVHTIENAPIDPHDLLPASLAYYSFEGSLTTPPCLEGVRWIMMAEPISASTLQLFTLRKAIGGANARPVQPLHRRVISRGVTDLKHF